MESVKKGVLSEEEALEIEVRVLWELIEEHDNPLLSILKKAEQRVLEAKNAAIQGKVTDEVLVVQEPTA